MINKERLMIKIYTLLLLLVFSSSAYAQITVNSIAELIPYLDDDNVDIKMTAGVYSITAEDVSSGAVGQLWVGGTLNNSFDVLLFSGNGSTYDFTDVTINIETETAQSVGRVDFYEVRTIGNNITIKNLTVVDDGSEHDAPTHRATNVVLDGANNTLLGCHFTVRGSYPYGYGDAFGKGGGPVISHNKRSACLVRGLSNLVKNCTFICRNYGHGIFFQGAVDPKVDGCYVEGELRKVSDVLAEEGTGSPADNVDFQTVFGFNMRDIVGDYYFSCQEAGVRSYNAGETVIDGIEYDRGVTDATVTNTTIVKMRVGVNIGWAVGTKYVENCYSYGCEVGYWVGSDTEVVNCFGDTSVGPLLSEDVERSNAKIELTLLDDHITPLDGEVTDFYFAGSGHNVILYDNTTYDNDIELVIGGTRYGWRFLDGNGSTNLPLNFNANDITMNNLTPYPLVLGSKSTGTVGQSCGVITDEGTSNSINPVEDCSAVCIYEVDVKLPVYAISGVNYTLYEGVFDEIPDFEVLESISSGFVENLDISVTDTLNEFAVVFDGTVEVVNDDRYTFYVSSDDPATLLIDDKEVVNYDGASGVMEKSGEICLEAGFHTIEIVRVEKNSDQTFQVSYESVEVAKTSALDIYGNDFSNVSNLAYLANATQSSTDFGGVPLRAADGDTNGMYSGESVTHSIEENDPWWQVELRGSYHIGEIKVFNRTDVCCSSRLGEFIVSVLDETGQVKLSQVIQPLEGASITIDGEGVLGNVIRVQKTELGRLALAEVEVYEGEPKESGGTFQLLKRNDVSFSIDGGGIDTEAGHSLALNFNSNHENLSWVEIDRGDGYFSYQKYNTELCIEGEDSEESGSDLMLETCVADADNQQWLKIVSGNGHYRLQRRNSQLVIDAGDGRSNGRNVYQDTLDLMSEDQQWRFDVADLDNLEIDEEIEEEILSVNGENEIVVYPNAVTDVLVVELSRVDFDIYNVYRMDGRQIIHGDLSEIDEVRIDFSPYESGIYILKLVGEQNSKTLKILKK